MSAVSVMGAFGIAAVLSGFVASAGPADAARAPDLNGAVGWLNSEPLSIKSLRGKVVLVNFWTYSCINSLRALPYLRAWSERYKDRGLVVIGVHTPEFAFEKNVVNVRQAAASLGVAYPIALDNDYRVWQAFDNQGWPGFAFIDADGRLRGSVLGEGDYDRSERLIQKLLSEAAHAPVGGDIKPIGGEGPQAQADWADQRSPETYIGYAKAENFESPGGSRNDVSSTYRVVPMLTLNHWSMSGAWTIGAEFATLNDKSGTISYRFHARDLHLVMAPGPQGQAIRFRIKIDGAAPGADHGTDVDAEGQGSVREPRMYQLVRQKQPIRDRTFEIEFLDPGVRTYVFTFG